MNRDKTNRSEAEHARIETEMDHILATEDKLMPSSGFAASVMDRVRQEAAMPAPTPFPWMMAILVILLASGAVIWGSVELVHLGLPGLGQFWLGLPALSQNALSWLTIPPQHLSTGLVRSIEQAGWVALALGSSLVSWLLSRGLAGRGGLL